MNNYKPFYFEKNRKKIQSFTLNFKKEIEIVVKKPQLLYKKKDTKMELASK